MNIFHSYPTEVFVYFPPFYIRVTHTNKPPEKGQMFQKEFPGLGKESIMVPSFSGNPKAYLGTSWLRRKEQSVPVRPHRVSHSPRAPPSCHHSLRGQADLPQTGDMARSKCRGSCGLACLIHSYSLSKRPLPCYIYCKEWGK